MKALRISASIFALTALSLLAACGGGGGGGGGTPPTSPPTGHPTTSPTTGPTSTPTTSPTSTPTSSGSVAVDGGLTVSAEESFVNGNQNWYTDGTAPWAHTAGDSSVSTAPTATGSSFDGMSCQNTPEGVTSTGAQAFPAGKFTQHAFVGIYFNNGSSVVEEALPQAIGLANPQAPTTPGNPNAPNGHPNNNYPVEIYSCSYNVHTHDYSGLVHIEDTSLAQSTTSPAYANLQSLMDLLGATLNASGLSAGPNSIMSGAVTIYVGNPTAKTSTGADLVNSYSVYTGAANQLVLNHHMAVWIVIGTTASGVPPLPGQTTPGTQNGLPQVAWHIQN